MDKEPVVTFGSSVNIHFDTQESVTHCKFKPYS